MKRSAVFFFMLASACAGSAPPPAAPEVDAQLDGHEGSARDEGERALASGRLGEAVRHLGVALERDPGDSRAKLHLALAHDLRGEAEAAEALLRELVEERPEMARAWSNLGSILLDRGADEEALACFERAIVADETLAEAHFGRGLVLEERGAEGALEAYREAIRLDPENPLPHLRAGLVLAVAGAAADSGVELRRAVMLAGDSKAVLAVAAGALLRLGHPGEAASAFERAREIDDGAALATEHLLALVAAKRYGDAARVADEALGRYPEALAIQYLRGVVHLRTGEDEPARAIFTRLAAQRDDPAIAARAERALAKITP